jgi:hypothetical protein
VASLVVVVVEEVWQGSCAVGVADEDPVGMHAWRRGCG